MRVLRVVGGLDAEFGGPPNSAANSIIAAQSAGIETVVVFPHREPALSAQEPAVQRLHAAGIETHCWPLNRRFKEFNHTRGVSTKLARWLWRHAGDYDLIHAESPWGLHCLAAVAAAKRHGKPIVLMPHTSLTKTDMKTAHNWVLWAMKRVLLVYYRQTVDGIIFASELERKESIRRTSRENWEVIYHPVVPPSFVRNPKSGSGVFGHSFKVGFLGRLHPVKNLESLIKALALLPNHIRLEVGGSGTPEYTNKLQELARDLDVENRMRWHGFVTDNERFYAGLDLLSMPSHHENFGLVAAEAMVSGLPVLVSQTTGVAEIVSATGAGTVIKPNEEKIAASIMRFSDSPTLRRSCSQRGRKDVTQVVSFSSHAAALRRYYHRIISDCAVV